MGNAVSCNSSAPVSVSKSLLTSYRAAGQAVQGIHLFHQAWDECVELQCQPKGVWCKTILAELSALDRYEIGVALGGIPVGGVFLTHDDDWHVGPCLTVAFQYVLPEYRNTGVSRQCMRYAISLAKELGYTVLAYSHRSGPWRYETIYRRIMDVQATKEKQSC